MCMCVCVFIYQGLIFFSFFFFFLFLFACVCVCVQAHVCVCMCVCVCSSIRVGFFFFLLFYNLKTVDGDYIFCKCNLWVKQNCKMYALRHTAVKMFVPGLIKFDTGRVKRTCNSPNQSV